MCPSGILEFVLRPQFGDKEEATHLKSPHSTGISVQLLLSHSKFILRVRLIIAGIFLNMLIYLLKKKTLNK